MKTMKLGLSELQVPVIAVGCWRMNKVSAADAERFVRTALDEGANFFDHADIYGAGACEEMFADAIQMNSRKRKKIITKLSFYKLRSKEFIL